MKKSLTCAAAGLLAAGLLGSVAQAEVLDPTVCLLPGGERGKIIHCDKIVFELRPRLAEGVRLRAGTPLDIKVCDDGNTVADLKGEVIRVIGVEQDGPEVRRQIRIRDVEYAAICSGLEPIPIGP